MSVLGSTVDLVVGGADLAFPGRGGEWCPSLRSRLSIGTVRISGEEMAKSTGDLVLVGDLLKDHSPVAIRLLLDRDWREAWDYDAHDLLTAAGRLQRLFGGRAPGRDAGSLEEHR